MTDTKNLVIGIVLIVLGVLMVLGRIGLGALLPFLGIVLIVVGILMLVNVVPGGKLVGILVLVLGILLQVHWFSLPKGFGSILGILDLIVGIVLIVLGALKLLGK